MFRFIKRAINFLKTRYNPRGGRVSFAGSGEDLIMSDILAKLGIQEGITYIDIGAYHPVYGSNTYYFYRKGGAGVLVEPNQVAYMKSKARRPRDICVNAGVGAVNGEAEFYSFKRETRNTFSKDEAQAWQKISGEKPVVSTHKTLGLDTIIHEYLGSRVPDIISIDTEGYEIEILNGFSWVSKPKIFCIEITSSSGDENKNIYKIMEERGYYLAGKTLVNSIFVMK